MPKTPAAPQLPKSFPPGPPAIEPVIEDEAEWWQLDLDGPVLAGAAAGMEIEQCRLTRPRMSGVRLEKSTVIDCLVQHGDLANLYAEGCGLRRVELVECRMTGLTYIAGALRDVVVRDCRLDLSTWRGSTFTQAVFTGCDLRRADFIGADLRGAVFENCDLGGAQFSNAKMDGARIAGCDLAGLGGVAALAGATVAADDLAVLAELLAGALGITVEAPTRAD
ncbi:pentapeptide repeat-containing protein [Hamadaea tsunoensis]|uniref:pentapeptide repeat-containing protein n=1 Tax=Hamadaea tsunoensis TaxID=53368 RepID=UPI0004186498|nr:pentapeptide repeat-containing protein [Hamadaea tsunoensis]